MSSIDTERFSQQMRARVLRSDERQVLIARIPGSQEAQDAYTHINCGGYGRIRRFHRYHLHLKTLEEASLPPKPLLRGHPPVAVLRSQVFQLAACNWRCWYCFVDDDRLSGDQRVARYFTAGELVELYRAELHPPDVLDLSGGQPDLVPEWNLWMMQALEERGLKGQVFLWTDDNLSNRYLWRYVTRDEISYMAHFPGYSRVGCFKGFDEASFALNTRADPSLFAQQFAIFRALLQEGFEMYAYATFPSQPHPDLAGAIARFMDRLQDVHPNLPLRTIPLKIHPFAALQQRARAEHHQAMHIQHVVYQTWVKELNQRFSLAEQRRPYSEIPLSLKT